MSRRSLVSPAASIRDNPWLTSGLLGISSSIKSFPRCAHRVGMQDSVTLFCSDFGRTPTSNGDGSTALGRRFVGGAVRGGRSAVIRWNRQRRIARWTLHPSVSWINTPRHGCWLASPIQSAGCAALETCLRGSWPEVWLRSPEARGSFVDVVDLDIRVTFIEWIDGMLVDRLQPLMSPGTPAFNHGRIGDGSRRRQVEHVRVDQVFSQPRNSTACGNLDDMVSSVRVAS
jgi:hypothetical protein